MNATLPDPAAAFSALHETVDAAPRRLTLTEADRVAARVMAEISSMTSRIAVAGSVRRRCLNVGDVDIVAEPKPGQADAIRARLARNARVVSSGDFNSVVLSNGVQIDLWLSRPEEVTLLGTVPPNWGSVLVCRTGNVWHNQWLIAAAKRRNLVWQPHNGVFDQHGELICCETEELIFGALDVPFVRPEARDR